MRHLLLALVGAAGLLTPACSADKATDTPTAVPAARASGAVGSDEKTNMVIYDLSLTDDTATAHGVRRVFTARAQQLATLGTRYAADTAGRATAQRAVNDEADARLQTIITDPAEYRKFLTHRNEYYAGTPFTRRKGERAEPTEQQARAPAPRPAASPTPVPRRRAAPAVVDVKRKANGEVRVKYANGTKATIGPDGQPKAKRGLFRRDRDKRPKKDD